MACRPGLLRGGRSLRDLYTPSAGAPVGRDGESSRRPSGGPGRSRYTPHEVGAPRVAGRAAAQSLSSPKPSKPRAKPTQSRGVPVTPQQLNWIQRIEEKATQQAWPFLFPLQQKTS